ncbi:hypothetical protein PVK06_023918 [Gossypium arboreum]|uniref:RNase H type-1 domain-containing protein n=1 Tax=Gossypium arboreum TaxID=29729 RepID=A0ABR0PCG9_GOSAR|nr:hypothetical protein PVK06_023918 [Gossypium arboreum]
MMKNGRWLGRYYKEEFSVMLKELGEVPSGYLDQSGEALNSEEQVHLFIDGAVQLDSGLVAAGGVLRDKEGQWIIGFHRFLGKCSVFNAELWGILEGLKLIQRLDYDHVIIHSDSLKVVKRHPR